MKIRAAVLATGALLGVTIGAAQAVAQAPARWTHQLTASCSWEEKAWVRAAGPMVLVGTDLAHMAGMDTRGPIVGPAERRALEACWRRRGWRGDPADLRVILTRWPS